VLAGVLLLAFYLLFAYVILDAGRPLAGQYAAYVNPLNQAFLFMSGILLAWWVKPFSIGWTAYPLLLLLMLIFWAVPASADPISIVAGHERMVLSAVCIAVVAMAFASGVRYSHLAGRALRTLGDLSYAVYLIHPVVAIGLMLVAIQMGQPGTGIQMLYWLFAVGVPLTLILSYASYRLLETPFLRAGGRLAAKVASGNKLSGRTSGERV